MDKALKYLGMTEGELDSLIEKRLSEGWTLEELPVETGIDRLKMLTPNDRRRGWCAEWLRYKGMVIPHWMGREL